jgi:ribosomal protein S18 acetylase RimI-like enzyme
MTLISRTATEADLQIIQDIVNANLLSLDPKAKRIGEIEAKEYLTGFFDPGITKLTKHSTQEDWESFITLNPDTSRKRMYLDVYTRPGAATLAETFELALQLARSAHPNFQLWPAISSNDYDYQRILQNHGFMLLRRYWTMEMSLPISTEVSTSSLGDIREIDIEEEIYTFHQVQQDSFSNHFGFMPRSLDEWREIVLRDRQEKNLRVWIVSVDGIDVGFMDCSDELKHEGSGYVEGLGVRPGYQGRGLGEKLLRHAITVNTEMGFRSLCLNVDAGNESGALRLYEKVGMKAISEWQQYENPKWSELTTTL